jgi:germination protein M
MPFRALVVSCLMLLVPVGCGSEEQASQDESPGEATSGTITEPIPTISTVPERAPTIVTVYFLRDGKVGASSRAVVSGPQIGRAAMLELLEGPGKPEQAAGLRTAIPAGTKLEGLSIADGTATIKLSRQLDPSAIAQVAYTLTQFSTVRRVAFGTEEGESPVGRGELEDFTPAILVESPTPSEDVSTPLRITGTANTFEATFQVEVLGADRRLLGQRFVTATSGSGTRGTFDANVTFAAQAGPATLVVFEVSAEDGSRVNEIEIPLQIGS